MVDLELILDLKKKWGHLLLKGMFFPCDGVEVEAFKVDTESFFCIIPETNSLHLKIDGWKLEDEMSFWGNFGLVSGAKWLLVSGSFFPSWC